MAPRPVVEKACTSCGTVKPRNEFYESTRSDGGYVRPSLTARCKTCTKENFRWKSIKKLYGLTKDEYLRKHEGQNGVCAICGRENPHAAWLSVDHDHSTGVVRGLLCVKCNQALGMVDEDPEILGSMIAYLHRHSKD